MPLALELLRAADQGRVASGGDGARKPLEAWLGSNGGGSAGVSVAGVGVGVGVGFGEGGGIGGGCGFSGDFGGGYSGGLGGGICGGGGGGASGGLQPPPPSEAEASELTEALLLALGRLRGGGEQARTPPSLRLCLQRLAEAPSQGSPPGPGGGGGLGYSVAPLELLLIHLEVIGLGPGYSDPGAGGARLWLGPYSHLTPNPRTLTRCT